MTLSVARSFFWAAPATLAYLVGAPLLALHFDSHLQLSWRLPEVASWLALLLIPLGAVQALWCVLLFATDGRGTPNPVVPPRQLVVRGPYRFSRNPMMLGGWLVGLGLALALRSTALLAMWLLIVAAGITYVRYYEEPRLLERFGDAYRSYCRAVSRWF
ncbi:MAG: isoprenylcysteine carboxylmethyltransferase family protein [bacterium]|nr:isoprenylcysteine carboxylmethyltransferase family protein [bacterium]